MGRHREEATMSRALFVAFVFVFCGVAQAAPVLYFTLEGRKQGATDAFAGTVEVAPGDIVEYRLQMRMAPFGTTNSNLKTQHLLPNRHGVSSLSISIIQDPHDPIQVDLNSPARLTGDSEATRRDGWQWGTGASGGTPTSRDAANFNDLLRIRPIHAAGVFTGAAEETVFLGAFTVATVAGETSQVAPVWGPTSGGGSFFGNPFYPAYTQPGHVTGSESSSDPLTHFTSLTLTAANFEAVPEPSTFALLSTVAMGFAFLRRSSADRSLRRRDSLEG
jgi:hypothetical protein